MKLNKATLLSSLGLSVIHFACATALTKFRPDFLASGDAGTIADKVQSVLVQPGYWFADFMGCIAEKPMWWVIFALNSVLWGNVLAFVVRTLSRAFFKNEKAK